MKSLPERIMGYAEAKPEATPIQAGDLLYLGDRAAVSRTLSRLARSERLLRICRGLYMRPIQTRFGLRAPALEQAITALASFWGETIVSNGGDAANWLGLTTQNMVRTVYFTSGPDRLLFFGAHRVELRHAPSWQLTAPNPIIEFLNPQLRAASETNADVSLTLSFPEGLILDGQDPEKLTERLSRFVSGSAHVTAKALEKED